MTENWERRRIANLRQVTVKTMYISAIGPLCSNRVVAVVGRTSAPAHLPTIMIARM